MKTALWIVAAFALSVGVIAVQHDRLKTLRERNNDLTTNVFTLAEGVRFYKTRDSLHAAGVGQLKMRLDEYRQLRAGDARLIESLKIRLRRVESVGVHATESRYEIAVPAVPDGIGNRMETGKQAVPAARRFAYRSPWVDLHGMLRHDSMTLTLATADTLVQVMHRVPRRFLFFRYGTKAIRQEIVSRNPHTRITYSETVDLVK